ncbi:VCBS domain-containing protein [Psychromonas sp. KJ10-10]|uniref:VCBS domain-containing protein n=1 Tax=Psychromonas sp. KJ10-10 TaxID=3391823 RepID=UPI0039B5AD02
MTVTITGTNDAPELTVSNLNAIEDGVAVVGNPSFTDVDLTDDHSFSVTPIPIGQGSVTIDPISGQYTYSPGSDFQSLALGATTDVSFDVTIDDGNGGTDTETVTVTITGTNDAPILTVSDLATDEETSVSGTASFSDIDLGDSHTFSVTAMPADQGSVSIDASTGKYTFNPGTDFQGLGLGDTQDVTFDVTVDDGLGGTDTETVTVTITGTNDAPELTVSNLNAIEDGVAVVGNPSFTDVDLTDQHSFSVTAMPAGQGSVSIDPISGQYTYSPGSDFQSLALGATTDVSFDVTIDDGNGGVDTETVTVTITGTNDAPILTVSDLATDEETSVSGTASFTDIDLGDTHTFSVTAMPADQGSVSIDASTGEYTFNPGTDFQGLGLGETQDVTFDVTVDDGLGGTDTETVTVTITGTNDAPELTVSNLNAIEDGVAVVGNPSFTDVDLTDDHSFSVTPMPIGQGSVTIDPISGQYTYSPGSDFQSLALGATTDVSFDVTIDDGNGGTDTETVTVTITGTNDAPILTVSDLATDEETSVSGTASFSDIDDNSSHTYSVSAMPDGEGSVTIDPASGEYTFDPESDFQYLAVGESKDVTFDVTIDDGEGGTDTQTVTVTITGTNDDPTLSYAPNVAEEDGDVITGLPSLADADFSDDHTFSVSDMPAGQGTVSIDSGTGQYTYNPGADFQSLSVGDSEAVSFVVTVDDENGGVVTETVNITVTGTNDKPELTVVDLLVDEDASPVSGTVTFDDIDANDTHTFTVTPMTTGQGTVSIDPNSGEYTFDPGTDFQGLVAGETQEVTFDVTIDDGEGGTDTQTVTVTITGTNDGPTLSYAPNVAEEDGNVITGLPSLADADLSDDHTFSVSDMPAGQGTVSIDSGTGQYTYNPGTDFQNLSVGDSDVVSFVVTVDDENGGVVTETVNITVTGTNDKPELTVVDLAVDEDAAPVSGTVTFDDIDANDTHTFTVTPMTTGQGTVSIDPNSGEYTFDPGTDFQGLVAGETQDVTFDVTIDDGNGGTDTETVTVTITGTNDAPVLSVTNLSADEDGIAVVGNSSFTDVDLTDDHSFSVTAMPAGQGTVSIDSGTGQYTYNPGSDFQSLGLDETQDVSFDVTVDDGNGGTDTETVTVTITGTNDDPVLTVSDLATDEETAVSGTSSFTEIDLTDSHSFSVTPMPAGQGTVSINASSGEYTFTPGSDFQSLAVGETQDVTFDVTIDDGNGGTDTETVTVTITGTNDAPVLSVTNLSADEDGVAVVGNPSFTDLDLTDDHSFSVTAMPAGQGTVSIDSGTGQYTYNPGSDFQSLGLDETQDVSFDVTVDDGNGGTDTETVTVTITGTNDVPVISVSDLVASEDGSSVRGTASFTDVDITDSHRFSVTSLASGEGSVRINANNGRYTYSPGSDFQSLALGVTAEVSFDVTVDDGNGGTDTETVTVTITGTNDAPILSITDLAANEDGVAVIGNASFTDVDLGDSHTYSVTSMPDGQGTVSIDSGTGQYIYDPGTDFQTLAVGETTNVTFDITVDDGLGGTDTETVTVIITGTNDSPVLSVENIATTEDGATVSGNASFTEIDIDPDDFHIYSVSTLPANQGVVTIDESTGEYTYKPGKNFQSLSTGETTNISFDVTIVDGQGGSDTETITVTITGTNDAPELTVNPISATEDGASVTGSSTFADVDSNDVHFYSVSLMPDNQGSVGIDVLTGQYTYSPDSDFQYLSEGATTNVTFDVTVYDGQGGSDTETVTVTITGTNDAPVLTLVPIVAVENGGSVSATASFTDVDTGDAHSYSVSPMLAGQGTVSINASTGEYTYNTGKDFESLAEGETTTVSFVVMVDDGQGGTDSETVTVTITGTNDTPEIFLTATDLTATEDGSVVTGTASYNDVDTVDIHTYSVTPMPVGQGFVSIDSNSGDYTFDPGSDFQSLALGATANVTFDVIADDGQGGTDVETVTVTITGTNDAPELTITNLATIENAGAVTGSASFTDVDTGDAHIYSVSSLPSNQGSVSINASTGVYTYNSGNNFEYLAEGDTAVVTFDVTINDRKGGTDTETVTVTITGTNDAPTIEVSALAVNEDGIAVTGTATFDDIDVDASDTHTYSVTPMSENQGFVRIDETTGVYTYDPGSDFQSLAVGRTTTVSFDVTVHDSEGGSSTKTVNVIITGTNDLPELEVTNINATEDGASVTGLPSFTDVDTGDAHAYSVSTMASGEGSVSIYASTGQYTYNPGDDFQSLAVGETAQVSFDVTVTDTNSGSTTETVTVTITGTNDDPILSVTDLAVMEDDSSIQGSASFDDADLSDTHFYSVTPMPANQGIVTIDSTTGIYTYDPDSDFQYLAEGETTQVTFDITVDDGEGGTDTETVTVTITGSNDTPILTVTDLDVMEDGVAITGTPTFTDLDLNDAHAYSVSSMPDGQGSVSILASTGEYTYNPGSDFQNLAEDVTTEVSFDITVTDVNGAIDTETVTVTITGTNDEPELRLTEIGLSEGGATITGSGSFTDVDDGDIHVYSVTQMPAGEGSVSIDASTGEYTYRPGSDFDGLATGETAVVTFDITVHDGQGGTDTRTESITITGPDGGLSFTDYNGNHQPFLTVEDISATEDGGIITGNSIVSDVDTDDVHTYTVTSMPAGQGSVTIDQDTGEYTFDPGNDFQELAAGATTDVTFDVTVNDGNGGTDTETVTVTITGTNDDVQLNVTDINANEDGASVTDTASFTDVDLGDAHFFSVTAMPENQGSVSISASTGEYTFNPGTDFQYLALNETVDVSFDITVSDGQGSTETETVTVTVTGANDDPILTIADIQAVEDGPDITGTATFEDLDVIDIHTFSVSSMLPGQGSVSIDASTGDFIYSPGNDFQSLATGDTTDVTFDVTVDDGNGGIDTQTVTVTITGSNENAVLTVENLEATEDGASVSSTPTFTDTDLGDAHFYSVTAMPAGQGSVSILASTGEYTYNPGSDFQSLAVGDTAVVSFDVTVDDREGGAATETVYVTITGTNDAPKLSVSSLSTTEDGSAVTGNATSTDVDSGDTHTYSVEPMPVGQGTVSIDASSGDYTFDPGTDFQYLAEGATTTVTFDVKVTDDNGATDTKAVSVTITGTNDAPILTIEPIEISEDEASVNGTSSLIDVDSDDLHFYSVTPVLASEGSVSILSSTGEYTYKPGNNFQSLAEGETAIVSFDVTVEDGQGVTDTETVTVTITGSNDQPILSVVDLSTSEDGSPVTGSVTFEDIDTSDVHSFTVSAMPAGQGTVSIDSVTGDYTFDPGTDFQSLPVGVTTDVTFDVTIDDGKGGTATETVTVSITGTNDAPVLTVVDIEATEDGGAITNIASFEGIDIGDAHSYAVTSMDPGEGSVSIFASTGEYTYNPGTDFQNLAVGESQVVSFDVTVSDGKGGSDTETVFVTVTGTNDLPELTVTDLVANEDGSSVSGSVILDDLDTSDEHTFTVSDMPEGQGSVTIDSVTGEYTFDPGSDFQYLAVGATTDVSFDVTVNDGNGGVVSETITVTVTGTNDTPDLTVTPLDAVEDSGVSVTGYATLDGIDAGDAHFYTLSSVMPASEGTVTIDATTGEYVYDLGDNFQSLAQGETTEVTFDVTADDGKGGVQTETVVVTITGTNDGPTAFADTDVVDENLTVIVDVLANDTDIDIIDEFTIDAVSAPKGTVSVNASNQLVFEANATDFDHLEAGQTEVVVVSYDMSDPFGGTSSSTATITITGTNDIPVAVADTGAVNENATVTIDVLANDTDADDNHSFSLDLVTAPKGTQRLLITN